MCIFVIRFSKCVPFLCKRIHNNGHTKAPIAQRLSSAFYLLTAFAMAFANMSARKSAVNCIFLFIKQSSNPKFFIFLVQCSVVMCIIMGTNIMLSITVFN